MCNDLQSSGKPSRQMRKAVRALTSREEKRCFMALRMCVCMCKCVCMCVHMCACVCAAEAAEAAEAECVARVRRWVGFRWDDDDAKATFCAARLVLRTSLQSEYGTVHMYM